MEKQRSPSPSLPQTSVDTPEGGTGHEQIHSGQPDRPPCLQFQEGKVRQGKRPVISCALPSVFTTTEANETEETHVTWFILDKEKGVDGTKRKDVRLKNQKQ